MISTNKAGHVLLGWEFGQGTGHARILKAVGDRLRERGCKVTFVLCTPSAGEAAGIAKSEMRQGPGWPLRTVPGYGPHSLTSASYGDIFAQMFLDVEGELDERLRIWCKIVDDERPDVVIADYAPGLSLACHGRIPLVAIGNGYTLPPADLASFPIIGRQPLKYREEEAVDRINQILAAHGLRSIDRLPEINRADHFCLLTYPMFDPYRRDRKDPWLGSPIVPDIPRRDMIGSSLFAYFYEKRQLDDRLIDGLVGGGIPGTAVFSTPIRRTAKRLAKADIEAPFGSLDLADVLPKTGVLVHQGGLHTCCAGAFHGIPQVIVYTDQEKKLHAQGLAERGAGIMLEWSEFTAGGLAAAIHEAVHDGGVVKSARRLADEMAPFATARPIHAITDAVHRFLN